MDPNIEDQIPESVTVGGISYKIADTPELSTFLDSVRKNISKTEKTKLYTTIKELQNEIKALASVEIAPPIPFNADTFKADIIKDIKSAFEPLINNVSKKTEFLEASQVADYKNRLLTENQGKCYPELIVGETKEALDAALASSIALWEKYTPPTGGGTPGTSTAAPIVTAPIVEPIVKPLPNVANLPAGNVEDVDISGLTQEQFAARRKELETRIKSLIPS